MQRVDDTAALAEHACTGPCLTLRNSKRAPTLSSVLVMIEMSLQGVRRFAGAEGGGLRSTA